MHKIYEYVCDELKDIEKKIETGQNLSANELEYADKLIDMKKNILKIDMLEDDGEYSHMRGRKGYSYTADDGMMYRGGSYARKRDAMGRYSRAEDDFMAELHELMKDAPDEHKRKKIQRLITEMEQM